jgi:2-polyprenyl-3-methyl-5-hydroxy-6-metoxy-1,4-benzoquinol methylase
VFLKTKYRTNDPEIMDDFTLEGEVLKEALDKIASINQFLGGNQLTIKGVQKLLSHCKKGSTITIMDVGCGNGDMLRKLADYGSQKQLNFELIGVDANPFTVNYAGQLSQEYANIKYLCVDVFDKSFNELKCDIVLCTLTLHHFTNQEISSLLVTFEKNTRIGFVVNDLQRSWVSYRLFQALCFVFGLNEMSRVDGLTSILRGFKKRELIVFSNNLNFKKYEVKWKWAFRYQWIVEK